MCMVDVGHRFAPSFTEFKWGNNIFEALKQEKKASSTYNAICLIKIFVKDKYVYFV